MTPLLGFIIGLMMGYFVAFIIRHHQLNVHIKLNRLNHYVELISERLDKCMATLDELLADVEAEKTIIDGVVTLLNGLKQQLTDALSGIHLSAEEQEKVDAIFAKVEENRQALAAALNANVEPPPQP